MLKTAFKNLLSHKLRMALTGFAIILGVGFVAGTYIFTDSINKTLDNLFTDVFAGVDVSVRPAETELGVVDIAFDESVLEIVSEIDGVAVAEPSVAGLAQFVAADGKPIGMQGAPGLGFSWTNDSQLNALRINEGDGRPPLAAGEVVVDKGTALQNNFKVGDRVKVLFNGPAEEFEIVGIATFGDVNSLAGATIAAFELKEAQRVFGLEGRYSVIDIRANEDVNADELREKVSLVLPDGLEAVTGETQASENLDEISQGLGFLNTALLTFAGVAIFVGSFIIQNTFRIIVSQRTRELALLRAIGATQTQVLRLVVYEAILIGLFASVLGIFLGVGVSYAVRELLNAVGLTIPTGPLTVEPRTIIVSMTVGLLVTAIAAFLPALRASKLAPIEALRDSQAPVRRKALLKRGVIGLVMIVLGGLLLVYGLGADTISNPIYFVGFGVAIQFLGVSVLAPLLSIPISRLLGVLFTKIKGKTAQLAALNAARSPRRTASTAAALMIGVSLITLVSILASSFKAAIDDIFSESFAADVTVSSTAIGEAGPGTASFSSDALRRLKERTELADVSALRYAVDGFRIEDDEGAFLLAAIEPKTFNEVFKLKPSDGAFENLRKGTIVVNEDTLSDRNQALGDTIEIEYAKTGKQTYEIVGTFSEAFDSKYLISSDDYLANFNDENVTFIAANYATDISAEAGKQAAIEALEDYPQLQVQDQNDLKEMARSQIDQVLALLWGLLAMAVIIAIFGITNTLMLSISERTREIGLLRAIGMTRSQLRSMIRYESIVIALFGAILGLVMGIFFAWAVVSALENEGIERVVISYPQLTIYLVMAVLAGILAAAWPAQKASRMDVLKAISYE